MRRTQYTFVYDDELEQKCKVQVKQVRKRGQSTKQTHWQEQIRICAKISASVSQYVGKKKVIQSVKSDSVTMFNKPEKAPTSIVEIEFEFNVLSGQTMAGGNDEKF